MKKYVITFVLLFLTSCSNGEIAAFQALGKIHDVKCYSGGVVIYEGTTTGKVSNEEHSDGYYFEDAKTHKLVSVSGNCVITVSEDQRVK